MSSRITMNEQTQIIGGKPKHRGEHPQSQKGTDKECPKEVPCVGVCPGRILSRSGGKAVRIPRCRFRTESYLQGTRRLGSSCRCVRPSQQGSTQVREDSAYRMASLSPVNRTGVSQWEETTNFTRERRMAKANPRCDEAAGRSAGLGCYRGEADARQQRQHPSARNER